MVGLVITAAGSGTRFGSATPKLLQSVNGIPLIHQTLKAFLGLDFELEAVVTVPVELQAEFTAVIQAVSVDYSVQVVPGGATRQASVREGVNRVKNHDYVIIHDAARPYVSKDIIIRVYNELKMGYDAVCPGINVTDTIKIVQNQEVVQTLDRSTLSAIQTPQGFKTRVLLQAYDAIKADPLADFSDEAGLVESMGTKVRIVEGDIANRKITYKHDII